MDALLFKVQITKESGDICEAMNKAILSCAPIQECEIANKMALPQSRIRNTRDTDALDPEPEKLIVDERSGHSSPSKLHPWSWTGSISRDLAGHYPFRQTPAGHSKLTSDR